MAFHDRMRAMVIRQLAPQPKGKGVSLTLTTRRGGYNPETGDTDPITVESFHGSGLRVNYSDYAYRNDTIVYGDFQIYLSPVQEDGTDMPKPSIADTIHFLDENITVIKVSPFNENSVSCGWKLQVRYG